MITTSSPLRGVLIVDKPAGPSSHAVVSQVRRALGLRKVGHAGTLDPAATGVLVVGVGSGTRLLGFLSGADKEYVSTFVLGVGTDTDDAQGSVTASPGAFVEREALLTAMARWTGDISQRPSSVSAIKIDGKRAYERVRAGEAVALAERPVRISAFELLGFDHVTENGVPLVIVQVRVVGSAGTYVRALARDVAADLGTVGHVRDLRRIRSGSFGLADAVRTEDIAPGGLLTMGEAARRSLPWLDVDESTVRLIRQGVQVSWPGAEAPGPHALTCGHDLVAVAEPVQGRARYFVVFTP